MMESMQRTYLQIRVLGSQHVVDAAGECYQYTLLASVTGVAMMAAGFDVKEWDKVTSTGVKVMVDFSDAAREDLKLPALETTGGSAIEPAKELREYLEELMRASKGRSSRSRKANEESAEASPGTRSATEPQVPEEHGEATGDSR